MLPEPNLNCKPRTSISDLWSVNKYLWLSLVFAAAYLSSAHWRGQLTVSLPAAFGVLGLAVLSGTLRTLSGYFSGGFNSPIRGWAFTLADAAIVSVGIRITGGIHSDLWLLFFVLTLSESHYASANETLALFAVVTTSYLVGTLPYLGAGSSYWVVAAGRLSVLLIVSRFARALAADRSRRTEEITRLREDVAANQERARIAREVHDSLGHALSGGILRLELARKLAIKDPPEAERLLKEEIADLRAAWNEGRDLAFHLHPWQVDPEGFSAGLRKQLARFAQRTGIIADLACPDDLTLDHATILALTGIIREALTNVARHSEAKSVTVSLERTPGGVRLTISDDGKGLPAGHGIEGVGFQSMRRRAEGVGYSLQVASSGSGTILEVQPTGTDAPLPQP